MPAGTALPGVQSTGVPEVEVGCDGLTEVGGAVVMGVSRLVGLAVRITPIYTIVN